MALILKKPWTRQPQFQTTIDRSNPLSVGLASAVMAGKYFDAVNGKPAVSSVKKGQYFDYDGVSRLLLGVSDYDKYVITGFTGDMTLLCLGVRTATSGSAEWLFSALNGVGNNIRFGIGSTGTSSTVFYTQPLGGGTTNTTFGVSLSSGTFVGVVSGTTQTSYLNGKQTASIAMTTSQDWSDSPFLQVGGDTFTGNIAGRVTLGLLWRRALSTPEIASISRNPWQLFTPIPRKLFLQPIVGTSGVCLLSDGSLAYKAVVSGSDMKVYLTATRELKAKRTPDVGDKLLTSVNGVLRAT